MPTTPRSNLRARTTVAFTGSAVAAVPALALIVFLAGLDSWANRYGSGEADRAYDVAMYLVAAFVPLAALFPTVCSKLVPVGTAPGDRPVRFGLVRLLAALADLPVAAVAVWLAGRTLGGGPVAALLTIVVATAGLGAVEAASGSSLGTWLAGLRVEAPSTAARWRRGLIGSEVAVAPVAFLLAGPLVAAAGLVVHLACAAVGLTDDLAGTRLAAGAPERVTVRSPAPTR
jgi:hypothetical protein